MPVLEPATATPMAVARGEPDPAVLVSVVVPTLRRQALLPPLVKRLLTQRHCGPSAVEVVIVDNCPDQSARSVVAALRAKYGERLRYLAEPRPGVSHVRNAGVLAARAPLIAFIDDDELPAEDWLGHLLACRSRYAADVVLGPVYPIFADPAVTGDSWFRRAFTQNSDQPTGTLIAPKTPLRALRRSACFRIMATNNALVDAALCRRGTPAFNPALTNLGGEDVLFFHDLYLAGKRIVWCREAAVHEGIPPERSELRYLLQRRFRDGQITSATCLLSRPRQYGRLLTAMTLGLLQLSIGASRLVVHLAARNPKARESLALVAGGAGKIAWMRCFQRRNYGLPAADPA